jgi:hypothetical protein
VLEYPGISNTYWKIGVGIFWNIKHRDSQRKSTPGYFRCNKKDDRDMMIEISK